MRATLRRWDLPDEAQVWLVVRVSVAKSSSGGQALRQALEQIHEQSTREKQKAEGKSWCEHRIWKPPEEHGAA